MTLPSVSVVVCAYTPDRLPDLIAAITEAHRQGPREVVVVIDHHEPLRDSVTAYVEENLADGAPIRVLANTATRGLSGARNTAVQQAVGDIVVFLDDDATPLPGWLDTLVAPFADSTVWAVGGSARPVWPSRRPAHLPPELDWVVGCTYEGQPVVAGPVRNVMGCNMAMRREVFDLVGGFEESAGRIGTLPLGCEETELCIRLSQQRPETVIWFEPAARVAHRVGPARLSPAYLRQRAYAEGVSKAAIAALVGAGDATSAERAYLRHTIPAGLAREVRRGVTGDRDGWRAAAGIIGAVGATGWGYLRGRAGGAHGGLTRAAHQARGG